MGILRTRSSNKLPSITDPELICFALAILMYPLLLVSSRSCLHPYSHNSELLMFSLLLIYHMCIRIGFAKRFLTTITCALLCDSKLYNTVA